jgi:hypothetical protein
MHGELAGVRLVAALFLLTLVGVWAWAWLSPWHDGDPDSRLADEPARNGCNVVRLASQ